MTAETIREVLQRQPFRPFVLHMNDGRKLEVKHPDFVLLPPGFTTTAIVAFPDERFQFVAIRNVSSLETEGPIPTPKPRRRRNGDEE